MTYIAPIKPATVSDYYTVNGFFSHIRNGGWGSLTDGFATRSEAVEAVTEASAQINHFSVIHVNLEEGTARDVTADMLAEIEAASDDSDECHSHEFQRREATLAGHFA